jgi:nucleotide-binding universal stress UspA family protein
MLEGAKASTMKIVLAIDDVKSSAAAVDSVIARGQPEDTKVFIIHMIEPPSLLVSREMRSQNPALRALWQETEQHAVTTVNQVAQQLRSKGSSVVPTVAKGHPRSRIIDVATKHGADLIVLGSHGRKGLVRFLMGSVSEAAARYASCSVEIARARYAN